jgi:hypothetical protein
MNKAQKAVYTTHKKIHYTSYTYSLQVIFALQILFHPFRIILCRSFSYYFSSIAILTPPILEVPWGDIYHMEEIPHGKVDLT